MIVSGNRHQLDISQPKSWRNSSETSCELLVIVQGLSLYQRLIKARYERAGRCHTKKTTTFSLLGPCLTPLPPDYLNRTPRARWWNSRRQNTQEAPSCPAHHWPRAAPASLFGSNQLCWRKRTQTANFAFTLQKLWRETTIQSITSQTNQQREKSVRSGYYSGESIYPSSTDCVSLLCLIKTIHSSPAKYLLIEIFF